MIIYTHSLWHKQIFYQSTVYKITDTPLASHLKTKIWLTIFSAGTDYGAHLLEYKQYYFYLKWDLLN